MELNTFKTYRRRDGIVKHNTLHVSSKVVLTISQKKLIDYKPK